MSLMTFLKSNVSWYIMWVQTVEVFSTDVRGGAASFVGLVSSIAGLSVPYLTMLVLFYAKMRRTCCTKIAFDSWGFFAGYRISFGDVHHFDGSRSDRDSGH